MAVKIIQRPNMKKYGVIFEVEIDGQRVLRDDGAPRRFQTKAAAEMAGKIEANRRDNIASMASEPDNGDRFY